MARIYSFLLLCLELSSSTMLLGSFHAKATYLVWLPRANTSPLLLLKLIEVYASVLPTAPSQHMLDMDDSNGPYTYRKSPQP